MGSSDSYTQLQASFLLVQTGSVSSHNPDFFGYCSVPSPNGRFYQAHDPGNSLLFTPAAALTVVALPADADGKVPLLGRLLAALTYTLVGGVCITSIYLALVQLLPARGAATIALLSACGTPLWIYARCTMDVLPAAAGVGLTLAVLLAHANQSISNHRAALFAALSIAATGSFRASTLPFLIVTAIFSLWANTRTRNRAVLLRFGLVLSIGLLPLFLFNTLRSGHPFILGTMHPRYAEQNGFGGKFALGLYGLLVSPNHGLALFAPWLVLGLFGFRSTNLTSPRRRVIVASLISALLYTVMIAGLKQWAKHEWGPRYLIPILPVVILPAGLGLVRLWASRARPVVIFFVALSVGVTLPAGIVNYSAVMVTFPGAGDPLAPRPQQIIGTYHALWQGIQGEPLEGPSEIQDDHERLAGLRFPDNWIARLLERGGRVRLVGLGVAFLLLVGLFAALRNLFSSRLSIPDQAAHTTRSPDRP